MNAKDLNISEYSSHIVFNSFANVAEGIRVNIKPVMIKEKRYLLMFKFIL